MDTLISKTLEPFHQLPIIEGARQQISHVDAWHCVLKKLSGASGTVLLPLELLCALGNNCNSTFRPWFVVHAFDRER